MARLLKLPDPENPNPVLIPASVGDPPVKPDSTTEPVPACVRPDETCAVAPPPKKMRSGGIFITGTVQKLVIIQGKSDDVDTQTQH